MKHILTLIFLSFFLNCAQRETINVGGSTTVLPVISNAAESYKETNPNIRIIVNAGGSGVGINQVGEKKLDIGMISRGITEQEKAKYPAINFNPISIGKDAVVPVVSSEIYDAGITTLSLEQIGKIYSGEIRNWKTLGGPDREILCVDKEASRGTRHVFMAAVFGDKEAPAPGADLVLGSNNEEQTALVQSNSAIGMLSNAWLNDDVKGLTIQMPNGDTIEPTLANIINGTFPITRDLVIVTNGAPSGKVQTFVDYVLGEEGQKIVENAGYVRVK
ncbi:MAG: phosphate ABC transporter substrate-binding protein [Balneola sp.]